MTRADQSFLDFVAEKLHGTGWDDVLQRSYLDPIKNYSDTAAVGVARSEARQLIRGRCAKVISWMAEWQRLTGQAA